jgi:hypothetical protein
LGADGHEASDSDHERREELLLVALFRRGGLDEPADTPSSFKSFVPERPIPADRD